MNRFAIDFNTALSVVALLGVSVVGLVQRQRKDDLESINKKIDEVRLAQTKQSERIDRIYEKMFEKKR